MGNNKVSSARVKRVCIMQYPCFSSKLSDMDATFLAPVIVATFLAPVIVTTFFVFSIALGKEN